MQKREYCEKLVGIRGMDGGWLLGILGFGNVELVGWLVAEFANLRLTGWVLGLSSRPIPFHFNLKK